jgi:hypothetical protein
MCITTNRALEDHVRCVPCHHGMARPQVVDEGGGLQIWRVAANIVNKQLQTADKGLSSSLGWAWGKQLLTVKNKLVRKFIRSLGHGQSP